MAAVASVGEWPPAAGEWPSDVEEIVRMGKQAVADVGVSMRVPDDAKAQALVNSKPEAYNPQMVSLGPYHHLWSKDKSHQRPTYLSQLELYKLKNAIEGDSDLIKRLFKQISEAPMMSRFQQMYHLKTEQKDIPEFVWMMTVDALFLHNFLRELNSKSKCMDLPKASIMCDIVKLENQIPLSLLFEVEKPLETGEEEVENARQRQTTVSQIKSLCCFNVSDINFDVDKEKHLLDNMHELVSPILQVAIEAGKWSPRQVFLSGVENVVVVVLAIFKKNPARRGHRDFLPKYNAKHLVNGGIRFQSFKSTDPGKITFDRNSGTLYLPRITISDTYTEVLLRNLLALEFNDPGREKLVTNYVELMDCLIDTPEDVALLRKHKVIERQSMMITDEYVAKMWDGMSKPLYLTGVGENLKSHIKEALINKYYNSKIWGWWDDFRTNYLSSPWKFAALVIGFFVLVLTVVQTYCTVKECQPEHPERERGGGKRFNRFG